MSASSRSSTKDRSIFTLSTGKPLEVGERRVAGAEVVDREPHAERPQAPEHLGRPVRVLHQRRDSVSSRHSALARAGRGSNRAPLTAVDDAVVAQLAGRHVDRHRQVVAAPAARGATAAAGGRPRRATHAPMLDDQAGVLGDRDELGRRDAPERRVVPAQQRLEALDAAVAEVARSAGSGACSSPRSSAWRRSRSRSRRSATRSRIDASNDGDRVAPGVLGLVHGGVGVADHRLGVDVRDRTPSLHGDADAGRGGDLGAAHLEGRGERAPDAARPSSSASATSGDAGAARRRTRRRRCGPPGRRSACCARRRWATATSSSSPMRVAVGVVDQLEAVDVEEQQRPRADRASAACSRAWPSVLLDAAAVGQAGEEVVGGLVRRAGPRTGRGPAAPGRAGRPRSRSARAR